MICTQCGINEATGPRSRLCSTCGRRPEVGHPLTKQEMRIRQFVCDGVGNKEIARQMHLTDGTVKVYISRIFIKTGVTSRTELAVRSLQMELAAARCEIRNLKAELDQRRQEAK